MNPGLVVKLRPAGPWRIGPDSGARNRVDVIYHSDSLYSAVTSAMARLGWLEEWLEATARTAAPAVSFSSCFPFLDEIVYVVPPRTVWPPASPSARAARIRWKSARFVPLTVVQAVLAGERMDENRWSVDGPSDCLVPAGKPGPFRTAVRTNASVDRLTGASDRYSTACIEFRPGSGLWTVVSFADEAAHEQWSPKVKAAFRWLADSGFGGERSRGWGRSEAPEFIDGMLPDMILPARVESHAPPVTIEPVAEAAVIAGPEVARLTQKVDAPSEEAQPAAVDIAPEAQPAEAMPTPEAAVAEPDPPVEPEATAPPAPEAAVAEPDPPVEPEATAPPAPEAAVAEPDPPVEPEATAPPAPEAAVAEPVPPVEPEATAPPAPEAAVAEPDPPVEPEAAAPPPPEPEASAVELPPAIEPPVPEAEPAVALPVAAATHPHWLLSLFTPAAGDSVDWRRGNYTVLARGGRIDSPAGSGELKKQIQMVAEGSVVFAESTPRGSAADVAPEGFAHPVFRAGFAVAIPLPEVR